MSLPSEAELRTIRDGFINHADFCAASLKIRNEQGDTVPLILSPAQAKQQLHVRRQELANRPVRQIGLKARRVRWSVGSCTQIFKRVAFLPGQTGLVMGHLDSSTSNLYGFFQQFVESYTPYHGLRMLPIKRMVQDKLIEWEGGSKITFQTAGSVESGRSGNYRHVLFDEYAFYRDATTLMRAALNTVPTDPWTSVFVVSTANGMGGPYYDLWKRASDPQAETEWAAVFFPWWEEPRYAMPLKVSTAEFQRTLTAIEIDQRRLYELSFEQLAWRRWKIINDCGGSEDSFDQEYPHSPEVAFLTSGRPRFDLTAIGRQPIVREPLAGELEMHHVGTRVVPQFIERADGHGSLRVWRRPEPGHKYVIGADPSKGHDVGEDLGHADPDFSVACVLDAQTRDQVAMLRARLTPYAFAEYLHALGRWFNDAYLIPEANELGLIEGLLYVGYPMERMYIRQREADERRPPTTQEIGWLTTSSSKLQLISALDRALREMDVTVRCAVTAQELRTFVYLTNGKVGGQPGSHDDCVIALALSVVGLQSIPRQLQDVPIGSGPQRYGQQQQPERRRILFR
jgi:hypothetical protein